MTQTNETILLQLQAAIEATRGTDLAATRKVYAQFTPAYARALTPFRNSTGTFHGRRRASYGREKPSWSASDEATYEDLPWWLQGILKGGVTGSSDGNATPAYLYAFNPTITADDLKSFRFEFGDSGNPYEMGQAMVTSATLRMDSDNDSEPSWMLDVSGPARDFTTTTFTGALADRTTEPILARGTKIFIDEPGGTIGTTQVTGKLISASIPITNEIHFKAFAEDTTYVAANKVGRGEQYMDGQLTFEFDSDGEFAKYRAGTQRLIRIYQEGATIHAGSPAATAKKYMKIDLYGYYSSWARNDREGNLTMTLGIMGFYDATATKSFSIDVNNALSSLA